MNLFLFHDLAFILYILAIEESFSLVIKKALNGPYFFFLHLESIDLPLILLTIITFNFTRFSPSKVKISDQSQLHQYIYKYYKSQTCHILPKSNNLHKTFPMCPQTQIQLALQTNQPFYQSKDNTLFH